MAKPGRACIAMINPFREDQEAHLLRQLRAGSHQAFETLLAQQERRVYTLALHLLGHPAEAEDVTQDTFIEVHRALPTFREQSRLDTWVCRIAVNLCLQRRRKRTVATTDLWPDDLSAPAQDDPVQRTLGGELQAVIAQAVETLPEAQRDVFILHEMEGWSYSEVAASLGCPVGTVKSRLSAALARLRPLLCDYVTPATDPRPAPSSVSNLEVTL